MLSSFRVRLLRFLVNNQCLDLSVYPAESLARYLSLAHGGRKRNVFLEQIKKRRAGGGSSTNVEQVMRNRIDPMREHTAKAMEARD